MVDKNKYNKMSQKKFEALMDRSERNILKRTEKLAQDRCQSGVPDDPADAKGVGVSGQKEMLAESKKKEK